MGGAPLQFEQAEFKGGAPGGRACGRCTRPIGEEYYEAGGHALCKACADDLGGRAGGKAAWLRGLWYGSGAALLGSIVWFAIIKILDMELGIIAVAVGLFVGFAVRKGSGGRGGWKYQALAMALTYASITAAYAPLVVTGMVEGARNSEAKKQKADQAAPAAAKAPAPDEPAPAPGAAAGHASGMSPFIAVPVFLVLVMGVALVAPFLGGAGNIMGLIIIAIALYEAWKINRRVDVSGPFRAGPAQPLPAAPAPGT